MISPTVFTCYVGMAVNQCYGSLATCYGKSNPSSLWRQRQAKDGNRVNADNTIAANLIPLKVFSF